jgi:cytidine kinase
MNVPNSDLTVLGHLSIDSISTPKFKTTSTTLGGAAAFVSLISRLLGAKTAIITKIGEDFPEEYLHRLKVEGIDLSGVKKVPGGASTRFSLEYDKSLQNRKLKLVSKAPQITVEDLPLPFYSKIIHVAPIAGEIQYDTVNHLRKSAGILSLDPQGFLRNFDEKGYVSQSPPLEERLLRMVDVYKSSQDEIFAATGQTNLNDSVNIIHGMGVRIVIVTQGALGLTISFEGNTRRIHAYHSRKTVDPTGAGDVFIGAFLAEYLHNDNLIWCASVGSAAASLSTENLGSTFTRDKQEIYKRSQIIYEKEIKQ